MTVIKEVIVDHNITCALLQVSRISEEIKIVMGQLTEVEDDLTQCGGNANIQHYKDLLGLRLDCLTKLLESTKTLRNNHCEFLEDFIN